MSGRFITSTPLEAMHALSFQGSALCSSYRQVRDLVNNRLGPEFSHFFAEPILNAGANSIDWYTEAEGDIRRIVDLSDGEREALLAEFRRKADLIRGKYEVLLAEESSASQTRGNVLQKALSWPDDSFIHSVGGQPVLVCWGFSGGGQERVRSENIDRAAGLQPPVKQAVTSATPQPPSAPVAPPPSAATETLAVPPPAAPASSEPSATKKPFPWLWLLLPLLLILFGLLGWLFRDRLLRLWESWHAPAPEPPAIVQPKPDESERADPIRSANIPPEAEHFVIPSEAKDLDFLVGTLYVDTGVVNEAQQPVTIRIRMSTAEGNGEAFISEPQQTCQGPAKAKIEASGLVTIRTEELSCPDSKKYEPFTLVCQRGSSTTCQGENKGGGRWNVQSYFVKSEEGAR
ncbi:MAG: hypothetical protein K6F46_02680 [Desulfovibrio sp.]|nr:hypothetical protein [Desulfovibrio sp.]